MRVKVRSLAWKQSSAVSGQVRSAKTSSLLCFVLCCVLVSRELRGTVTVEDMRGGRLYHLGSPSEFFRTDVLRHSLCTEAPTSTTWTMDTHDEL